MKQLNWYRSSASSRNDGEGKSHRDLSGQQSPFDLLFEESFLHGEGEYVSQQRKLQRYTCDEKPGLGEVVDFLFEEDVSSHLVGLSVCESTDFAMGEMS